MPNNVDIDAKLLKKVLRTKDIKTKREALEFGLLTLLRLKQQEEIRQYRGKFKWSGSLEEMRKD